MMKHKQLFVILFLTGIITTTINAKNLLPNAYTTSHSDSSGIKKIKKIKWFIQAGILDANAKESYFTEGLDIGTYYKVITNMKSYTGFKLGLFLEFPVYKNISFSSGLSFIRKGTGTNDSNTGPWSSSEIQKYRMDFIEMPINFTYKVHDYKGITFGLGITLSYGIGGRVHDVYKGYDSTGINLLYAGSVNTSIIFDGNTTFNSDNHLHYKPWELGGNIFFGYRFSSKYIIKAEYNKGFSNMFVDGRGTFNSSFKTSYFALNFCYGL